MLRFCTRIYIFTSNNSQNFLKRFASLL